MDDAALPDAGARLKPLWLVDDGGMSSGSALEAYVRHNFASIRYRVGIPATQIIRHGHQPSCLGWVNLLAGERPDADCTHVIVGQPSPRFEAEHLQRAAPMGQALRALQGAGMRIVANVCDDLFRDPVRGPFMRDLIAMADLVVACSDYLADAITEECGREATVIADPVEGARGAPRFDAVGPGGMFGRWRSLAGAKVRLCWFGGQWRNLTQMLEWLPRLASSDIGHIELSCVTNPMQEIADAIARAAAPFADRLQVSLTGWSLDAMRDALRKADIVFLPSDPLDRQRLGASPNRLTEAIWAGCWVAASPLPSYMQFGDSSWVREDMVAGVEWAVRHPREVMRQIETGQTRIEREFTPEAIGLKWEAALRASHRAAVGGGPE